MPPKAGNAANRKKGQRAGPLPPPNPLLDLLAHWQAANENVRPSVAEVPKVDPATAPAEALIDSIRQRAEAVAQAAIEATPAAVLFVGHQSLLPPPSRPRKGIIAESSRVTFPEGPLWFRVEGRCLSDVGDLLANSADDLERMSSCTPDHLLQAAANVTEVFKQPGPCWLTFVLLASTLVADRPVMTLQQGVATVQVNRVVLDPARARLEWGDARVREARGDAVGRLWGHPRPGASGGAVLTPPFEPDKPWVFRLEALGAVETLSANVLSAITRDQPELALTVTRQEAAEIIGITERQLDRCRKSGLLSTVQGKRLLRWQVDRLAAERGMSTPRRKK